MEKHQGLHVLVVGAGSIGTRHLTNLQRMETRITVVETGQQERRAVHAVLQDSNILASLEDALTMDFDAAMVCVPTYLHADTAAVILEALKVPIFIEKPISHNQNDALFLNEMAKSVGAWGMVGYSLRHHPPLVRMKELLDSRDFGNPLYIRAEVGQWLPDWHPGRDYRHWYMSSEEQGGGAVTDLSHEIDYVCWLMKDLPTSVIAVVKRVSSLEIDTDDIAELILKFDGGAIASIHMDLISRSFYRRCFIECTNGNLKWGEEPATVSTIKAGQDGWINTNMDANRNIQFQNELEMFLDGVLEKKAPRPNISDGIHVLDIIQAAKESSKTGREIRL